VNSVAFSPSGSLIATGSADKAIRFWNFADSELTLKFETSDPVRQVRFSPDGRIFASISENSSEIHLWGIPAD
jgi:WD40 repeat protein